VRSLEARAAISRRVNEHRFVRSRALAPPSVWRSAAHSNPRIECGRRHAGGWRASEAEAATRLPDNDCSVDQQQREGLGEQRIYELDAEIRQNRMFESPGSKSTRSENRIAFNRQRAEELAGRLPQVARN